MKEQIIKAETICFGYKMKVFNDLSISIVDLNTNIEMKYEKEYLQKIANQTKNANRIHKPIPLLFWIDVKNDKKSNWIKKI
jgi:hypothetical protein